MSDNITNGKRTLVILALLIVGYMAFTLIYQGPSITGFFTGVNETNQTLNETNETIELNETIINITQEINQTNETEINITINETETNISTNQTEENTTIEINETINETEVNETLNETEEIVGQEPQIQTTEKVKLKKSPKIKQDVEEALEEQENVRVIVTLKEPKVKKLKDKRIGQLSVQERKPVLQEKQAKIQAKQAEVIQKVQEKQAQKFEVKTKLKNSNKFSAEVSADAINELINDPDVLSVEVEPVYKLFLQDSVPLINADDVQNSNISGTNIDGSGVTVCVIDSGIDYNNSDLGGTFGPKVIGGYDYVNDDEDPMDDNGHGTHVAGIIAANGGITGVAPEAKLVALKACNSTGDCLGLDVAAGIEWCTNNASEYNISIISMSLGGGIYTEATCPDSYENETQDAIDAGITVIASSGNEYDGTGIASPSCLPQVISVGSSSKTNGFSEFSNRNSDLDILAPGAAINSTAGTNGCEHCTLTGYKVLSGTSMAAPHASGEAALLIQYQRLYSGTNLTPQEIEHLLKKTNTYIYDALENLGGTGLTFPRIDAQIAINSILKINETDNSVEEPGKGKIKFATATDFDNSSIAVEIGENYVYVNSSYDEFNKSANITMYNLSWEATPVVYADGELCTDCNVYSYNGDLVFGVSHFTNYTSGANANLSIWDDGDIYPKIEDEDVKFYANYTNITSGATITGASCNITFTDGLQNMVWNATSELYEYNRTFATLGLKEYNVSCNHSDYEYLETQDNIQIYDQCQQAFLFDLGSGKDWNITGDTVVECNDTELYFNNQDVNILDNATLILRNSTFVLNTSTTNNVNVTDDANFTAFNSSIQGYDGSHQFNLKNYGEGNYYNTIFNNSDFYIYGNRTHNIDNCSFYEHIYFYENSTNIINNSQSLSTGRYSNFKDDSTNFIYSSYFKDDFYAGHIDSDSPNLTISNSTFDDYVYFRGSSKTNFSQPKSSLNYYIRIDSSSNHPYIYGYVDMPNSAQISTDSTRFYPIYINSTETWTPVDGLQVNITNSTGSVVWTGTTDANGYIEPNITFTSSNYGENNFTIVPEKDIWTGESDINLLTDTPIILETGDCLKPYENMQITRDTTLCSGTYYLNDSDWATSKGIIQFYAENVILTCEDTTLIGNSTINSTVITTRSKDNITIQGCTFANYSGGITTQFGGGTGTCHYCNITNNTAINDSSIYLGGFRNSTFNKNILTNSDRLTFQSSFNSTISQNSFNNTYIWFGGSGGYTCGYMTIDNNTFVGGTQAFSFGNNDYNNTFSNNFINDVTIGIKCNTVTELTHIINNTINDTSRAGILSRTCNLNISGNNITNHAQYGVIFLDSDIEPINISQIDSSGTYGKFLNTKSVRMYITDGTEGQTNVTIHAIDNRSKVMNASSGNEIFFNPNSDDTVFYDSNIRYCNMKTNDTGWVDTFYRGIGNACNLESSSTYFAATEYEINGSDVRINHTPHTFYASKTNVGSVYESVTINETQQIINLTLDPLNVVNITPFGTPIDTDDPINYSWYNASEFPDNLTTINVSENETIDFNATFNFIEMVTYTLTWTVNQVQQFTETITTGVASGFSWFFDFFSAGEKNISLTINASDNTTDEFNWTVNVLNTNREPVLNISNRTIAEDGFGYINLTNETIELDTDDTLIWTLEQEFASEVDCEIINTNNLTLTPAANWFGLTNCTINVTDGSGGNDTQLFYINVTAVNDAPNLNLAPLDLMDLDEDSYNDTINLSDYTTDIDDVLSEINYSCYTNNTNVSAVENNDTKILNITATNNFFGTVNVSCIANDTSEITPGALTSFSSYVLNVNNVNDAPVVSSIPDIEFDEDTYNDSVGLDDYVNDIDNLDSEISWTCLVNDTNITIDVDGTTHIMNVTSAQDWNGNATANCTAEDPSLASDISYFNITVNPVNDAPTAPVVDVIPDGPSTIDDLTCSIITPSEDADGDTVTYNYTWFNNSVQTSITSHIVGSGNLTNGDIWNCTATPWDGTVNGTNASAAETVGSTCGDGTCDPGEDCSSCPADCGACTPGGGSGGSSGGGGVAPYIGPNQTEEPEEEVEEEQEPLIEKIKQIRIENPKAAFQISTWPLWIFILTLLILSLLLLSRIRKTKDLQALIDVDFDYVLNKKIEKAQKTYEKILRIYNRKSDEEKEKFKYQIKELGELLKKYKKTTENKKVEKKK